ncbi:MAG: PIN domain-containing protein [Burkholderiales bacterium]|nr:PIN domain-containing protein [Burkholderiales bacterium]
MERLRRCREGTSVPRRWRGGRGPPQRAPQRVWYGVWHGADHRLYPAGVQARAAPHRRRQAHERSASDPGGAAAAHRALLAAAYRLEPFGAADVARANEVLDQYADLDLGLADASIVVLARRHGLADVLTLDERHFRPLRVAPRRRFRILPFDR